MRGHKGRPLRIFNGDFNRGSNSATPPDHFIASQNVIFTHRGVSTRYGLSLDLEWTPITEIVRAHLYERLGEVQRWIILDSDGNFYDSTDLSTPILSIPAATDFSMLVMFNRAYISPHNGEKGLAGEFTYVYQGSGLARKAAGVPPSSFVLGVVDSASAGNIEAGFRLFAVAYETDSGYITKPGPVGAFTLHEAAGGKIADVSSIPTGPSYVNFVYILATKRIIGTYSGNPNDYELFFIPNARLANGTATYAANFFDSELLVSADYLLDELEEIPAYYFLVEHNGRLVGGRLNTTVHVLNVSKVGEPESISSIDGFVLVRPGDASNGVSNAEEFRSWFYITKDKRTYVTRDTGFAPSSWPVDEVDGGLGTDSPFGIGRMYNKKGTNIDKLLVADESGLVAFNGVYEEKALTWKIQDDWDSINWLYGQLIQVFADHVNKLIYVTAPTGASTTVNTLFVGDYKNGLNPVDIRWTKWVFPSVPLSIGVSIIDKSPVFKVALTGGIYKILPVNTNDFNNVIVSYFEPGMLTYHDELGLSHATGVRLEAIGSGELKLFVFSLHRGITLNPPSLTLTATPDKILERIFNFKHEYIFVRYQVDSINDRFEITSVTLFGKKAEASRPSGN